MTPVIYGFPSRFLLVVCVLFSALVGVPAQQANPKATPTPVAGQDPEIIPTFIRRVRLPISVTDKKGVFVSGLSQSDFLVLEDKLPQQIETFSDDLGEESQLYIAVLMDTSPSTAGKLRFEQESAMNFIQTVVRPRKDRVLFATFDHEIVLKQDFTDKLDLLDKAVFGVKKLGTQTAFYDAIWQFCDEKLRSASGRRVLVVITDGEDTYSRADLRDAIDIAQRTETTVFAISTKAGLAGAVPGVQMGQVNSKADHNLVKLAEETGGRAFFTGDMLELEKAFNRIKKELRAQYLVTYKPSNDRYDGSFRKIEVRLNNVQGGLRVHTKDGYKAVADSVRP
ncbi:MAG: VWA domain-containing protein [Pyrinomonadaceae bacterium]|nr:VWA domain-containing protein [Pyrinomonadaceae bacterium]